jgi:hypothetical protein
MRLLLQANFAATSDPVDPNKLRVRGGRTVDYDGETYKIQKIDKSPRKNKKYVATVKNTNTGKTHNVHWGHTEYDDYYVHKDKKRRENFQKRHGAIKLKSGKPAAEDPRQPAYYATKANWSFMSDIVNFKMRDDNGFDIPSAPKSTKNDAYTYIPPDEWKKIPQHLRKTIRKLEKTDNPTLGAAYNAARKHADFAARITPLRMDILSRRWGQMYPELNTGLIKNIDYRHLQKQQEVEDNLTSRLRGINASMKDNLVPNMQVRPIMNGNKLQGISSATEHNGIVNTDFIPNPRHYLPDEVGTNLQQVTSWLPQSRRDAKAMLDGESFVRGLKENYPGSSVLNVTGHPEMQKVVYKSLGATNKTNVSKNPLRLNEIHDWYDTVTGNPTQPRINLPPF